MVVPGRWILEVTSDGILRHGRDGGGLAAGCRWGRRRTTGSSRVMGVEAHLPTFHYPLNQILKYKNSFFG